MFSSEIPNPIKLDKCVTFPIGHKCSSALSANIAGIRHFSLPLDWCEHLFPKKLIRVFENNFEDFLPDKLEELVRENTSNVFYYKNKYDIHICHIDINKQDEIIRAYKRRVLRAIELLSGTGNICFLYINEAYLWDRDFRSEEFNKKTFDELVELDTYIKTKYPTINYKILFIDFVKHKVPIESNIVMITVKSRALYDVHLDDPVNEFRNYCAKIIKMII
jgi:hypothetical protein